MNEEKWHLKNAETAQRKTSCISVTGSRAISKIEKHIDIRPPADTDLMKTE